MGKGRDAPNLVTHLTPQKAKSNKKNFIADGPTCPEGRAVSSLPRGHARGEKLFLSV